MAGGRFDLAGAAVEAAREHILLKFRPDASASERQSALASVDGRIQHAFGFDGREYVLEVRVGEGQGADQAVSTAAAQPGVAYAEPDYVVHKMVVSNDPGFTGGQLWGMSGDKSSPANAYGSQAAEAWVAGFTGSTKVAVGVIDSGVDYTHPDLYLNIWLNNNEIPTALRSSLADIDNDGIITFRDLNASANSAYVLDVNGNGRIDAGDLLNDSRWEDGVDNDLNGYSDDLIGWDFVNFDNDPYDDDGHGTHVAGTIAATGGNGIGVAGIAWSTLIVPLKFLDAQGSGYLSDAVEAIDYFTNASTKSVGVDFVATNNSWGGGGYTSSLHSAIVRAAKSDILFVAAAGNGGSDGYGDNNNSVANYPSNYNTTSYVGWDSVIGVAAITSSGSLASYSNYGSTTVEIGAPGSYIYSTIPGGGYAYMSGTSMATPHVTGAIALYAAATGAGASAIRASLLNSGAATASLSGLVMTGDRLDVMAMIQLGGGAPSTPPPPQTSPSGPAIYGTTGWDTIRGTSGSESLSGVPQTGTHLGKGTVDTLWGMGGNDTFILGDSRGRFYDDGNILNSGSGDYVRVMDFNSGDKLQLKGPADDYFFKPMTLGGKAGISIYFDTNNNMVWDSRDELIAWVSGPHMVTSADALFI